MGIEDELDKEIVKCLKKRCVKQCEECCRYDECYGDKPTNFPTANVAPLVGAIVYSALFDLYHDIPPLSHCKTKSAREKRKKLIYNKATAKNFFKSKLFFYTHLDFEYISSTFRRLLDEEKIPQERH